MAHMNEGESQKQIFHKFPHRTEAAIWTRWNMVQVRNIQVSSYSQRRITINHKLFCFCVRHEVTPYCRKPRVEDNLLRYLTDRKAELVYLLLTSSELPKLEGGIRSRISVFIHWHVSIGVRVIMPKQTQLQIKLAVKLIPASINFAHSLFQLVPVPVTTLGHESLPVDSPA